MRQSPGPTPYQTTGGRTNTRRTVLVVVAAVAFSAIGLMLHVVGVLPPQ
ncbi:hypothetical protein [Wenjunlia vitaminophila]|nr:hypothetical protein [Wenjunlia vitaminophila]